MKFILAIIVFIGLKIWELMHWVFIRYFWYKLLYLFASYLNYLFIFNVDDSRSIFIELFVSMILSVGLVIYAIYDEFGYEIGCFFKDNWNKANKIVGRK